jgi:hypothetical protein
MKFSLVFVLFNLINVVFLLSKNHDRSVSIAFNYIKADLIRSSRHLKLLNFADDERVFTALCRNPKINYLPQTTKTKEKKAIQSLMSGNRYNIDESAILVVETIKLMKKFNTQARLTDLTPKKLKLYVYSNKMTINEVSTLDTANINARNKRDDITDYFNDMNDVLGYQYFVVNEKKSMKLLTFVWYTQQNCSVPQLVEINQFDKNTNKWNNSNFSIDKHKNFHDCRIVVGIKGSDDEVDFGGFSEKIVTLLSEALKFKLVINKIISISMVPNHDPEYAIETYLDVIYRHENLTVDFVMNMQPDFNGLRAVYNRNHHLYIVQLYGTTYQYFAVPPGSPYDAFDKLYLPFDLQTWLWTLITFLTAFATVFIVLQMKAEVKDFVFGRNVRTPFLNILAHFFGLSQTVLPRRNFARFLLMSFILLSFIIRTLYQGIMCDYLQKDMRFTEPVKSVKNIGNMGYKLIVQKSILQSPVTVFQIFNFAAV